MKTLLALLSLFIAHACLADEPLSFPSVTTTQGVTYYDVKVTKFDALQLKFVHRTGAATVPLSELPEDLQKIFGYDPVKASFEMILQQEERRNNIITEADKKAKQAALIEQQRVDQEELKSIREHPLRCHVDGVYQTGDNLLLQVLPVEKQPVTIRSKSGKYERVKLNGQGKPELVEQVVQGKAFSLGGTLQILPKTAMLAPSNIITVYLVELLPDRYPLCALTAEEAFRYRRKIAALKKAEEVEAAKP